MRKSFLFYRSYADVALRLNSSDRLAFYDALISRQFTGVEPVNLPTMADFAYHSQKHSIDQQIRGYETKTKSPLTIPPLPNPHTNPHADPHADPHRYNGNGNGNGNGNDNGNGNGNGKGNGNDLPF